MTTENTNDTHVDARTSTQESFDAIYEKMETERNKGAYDPIPEDRMCKVCVYHCKTNDMKEGWMLGCKLDPEFMLNVTIDSTCRDFQTQ